MQYCGPLDPNVICRRQLAAAVDAELHTENEWQTNRRWRLYTDTEITCTGLYIEMNMHQAFGCEQPNPGRWCFRVLASGPGCFGLLYINLEAGSRWKYQAMGRRNALITGAGGAIGKAIARHLAREADFRVSVVCRDQHRARQVVRDLNHAEDEGRLAVLVADLSRPQQVFALGRDWTDPLHLLINAAAVAPRRRQETREGVELQFATNVLGYFWMIQAFAPHLVAGARIVNLASYWAGGLDLDDLEFRHRSYDNNAAYRQAKQADRMLSSVLAEHLETRGVAVNACHPGDVNSVLSNNLGFGGSESAEQAADTPLWLALSPAVQDVSGGYFERRQAVKCRFSADREQTAALYDYCVQRTRQLETQQALLL